jgi:glutaredoxin-related protein
MRVLQALDSIQLASILRADSVSQTIINTSEWLTRPQMIEDIKLKERGMDKDQLLFNAGASTK